MGETEIIAAWQRGLRRPDRREIWRIAREEVNLQGDYDPKGYFRVESSRYLLFPFALLLNPLVRMLNLLKSIQTGGTLVGDLFFYHCLRHMPGPFMFTLQTDDDAEQHYLTRIEPTLKESPLYVGIHTGLHKKRDLYQFPGMNTYFQGANMNSLQRKSIKNEVNDEVWDWPAGMLAEAWGRTERFSRSCKIINISQGGEEGTDWDHAYHAGKIHEWGVFCFNCGHHNILSFFGKMLDNPKLRAGIVWDDRRHPSGRRDIDACANSARFRCCKCGHEHANEPRTWERFNASGEYIDTDPLKPLKNVSCHWESLVNGNYDSLVASFLKATEILESGSPAALKKFYQKYLARMWAIADSQEKIEVRTSDYNMEDPFAEGYKPVPEEDELKRFITADFQEGKTAKGEGRHFRVAARAWLTNGRSRLLYYGRIDNLPRHRKSSSPWIRF
jgi:phage terminase large subunit GpA-like protein